MRFTVYGGSFGRSWNVRCVAVIPGVSLVHKVVEGDECEGHAERSDAPSSYSGHDEIGLCPGRSDVSSSQNWTHALLLDIVQS